MRNLHPLSDRRIKLEAEMTGINSPFLDLSEQLPAHDFATLNKLKEQADPIIEGIMLKKRTACILPDVQKDAWVKLNVIQNMLIW